MGGFQSKYGFSMLLRNILKYEIFGNPFKTLPLCMFYLVAFEEAIVRKKVVPQRQPQKRKLSKNSRGLATKYFPSHQPFIVIYILS